MSSASPFRAVKTAVLLCSTLLNSLAFSIIGPFESWQTPDLDFKVRDEEVAAPKNLGEEYRWSTPVITYDFDATFRSYFGRHSIAAVEEAIRCINDLPPASQIDLTKVPEHSLRIDYRAQSQELVDLKSLTLSLLLEQLGIGRAQENVFILRSRTATVETTNYFVVQRNFDPLLQIVSEYINGTRFHYQVFEANGRADAFEINMNPEPSLYSPPVSTFLADPGFGLYVSGLTRDDVGAYRYLYHTNNVNLEGTIDGAGLFRAGVDKITFQHVQSYPTSITYLERFTTGEPQMQQRAVTRVVTRPDILFRAAEFQKTNVGGFLVRKPAWFKRTLNFHKEPEIDAGPGIILPGSEITFATISARETSPDPLLPNPRWGSFNGFSTVAFPAPDEPLITIRDVKMVSENNTNFFSIRLEGVPRVQYTAQSSANLVQWEYLNELREIGINPIIFSADIGQRFFRILVYLPRAQ